MHSTKQYIGEGARSLQYASSLNPFEIPLQSRGQCCYILLAKRNPKWQCCYMLLQSCYFWTCSPWTSLREKDVWRSLKYKGQNLVKYFKCIKKIPKDNAVAILLLITMPPSTSLRKKDVQKSLKYNVQKLVDHVRDITHLSFSLL